MPTFVLIILLFMALGVGVGVGFLVYRSGARYQKSIERGLKIVTLIIHLPPSSEDTDVGSRDVRDVVEEKLSQAETLYNVLSSTSKSGLKTRIFGQRHISFEIIATKGMVNYYVSVPVSMVGVIEQAILSSYPSVHIEESTDHNIFNPVGKIDATTGGEMHLKKEFAYPIATFRDTRRDAMQSILNALSTLSDEDGAAIQIMLRPAFSGWDKVSRSVADNKKKDKKSGISSALSPKDIASAFWKVPESNDSNSAPKDPLSSLDQAIVDAIEQKTRNPGYEVLIRIIASSNLKERAQVILHNLVATFSLFDSPSMNGFKFTPTKNTESLVTSYIMRFFPPNQSKDVLNSVELATIFHFPDQQFTSTSQVQRQESKQVDGPRNLAKDGLLFGYNEYRGIKKEIRVNQEDRRRHTYIVGQTGTGKSQLLQSLALQDMQSGNGFAFIDPHGDSVEDLLELVPRERTEDIIYFSPSDTDYPLGLNLFEFQTEEQKDFLIQEAINMLYKLYDPQRQGIMGPRYEHLFRNAALTVMADPGGSTFIDIPKLFSDRRYVQQKLKYVKDPSVIDFWTKEMPDSQRSNDFGEVKSWFVSKFGAFLLNTMMRNMIGQTKSAFSLRDVMDNKKILLVNLSKGQLGELNSKLLGMIFVMKFQVAAMSRANLPQNERQDFSLYVDEFQNYSTESIATILSEARKYRLNLIVANQFIGQLSEDVRDSVFGNVGNIISLRCSSTDADFLSKQFSPTFEALDLVNLPNFHSVSRVMVNGVPSQPFSMTTMTTFGNVGMIANPKLKEALKQLSAAKYGKPKSVVEKDINKRFETPPSATPYGGPVPRPYDIGTPSPISSQTSPAMPANIKTKSFLDEWLAKRRSKVTASTTPNVTSESDAKKLSPSIPRESPSQQGYQPSTTSDQTIPHQYLQDSSMLGSGNNVSYTPPYDSFQPAERDEAWQRGQHTSEYGQKKVVQPLSPKSQEPSQLDYQQAIKKTERLEYTTSHIPKDEPTFANEDYQKAGNVFSPHRSPQSSEPQGEQQLAGQPIPHLHAREQEEVDESKVIANLKPGEVYVDKLGRIHQGNLE